MDDDTKKTPRYTPAELAAIRAEVEHEDEIDQLRAEQEWESDYRDDGSGQWADWEPAGPMPEIV